jgi:hypothetical protein
VCYTVKKYKEMKIEKNQFHCGLGLLNQNIKGTTMRRHPLKEQIYFMVSLGLIMLLVASCSSLKKVGVNKYEMICSGDDDMGCQGHAWSICKGPFKTINDSLIGAVPFATSHPLEGSRQVYRYKYVFECDENK